MKVNVYRRGSTCWKGAIVPLTTGRSPKNSGFAWV